MDVATTAPTAQRDYIRGYVQRMENALFADRASGWTQHSYLDYIDRGSWVDHHILNTLACNPDAFVRWNVSDPFEAQVGSVGTGVRLCGAVNDSSGNQIAGSGNCLAVGG